MLHTASQLAPHLVLVHIFTWVDKQAPTLLGALQSVGGDSALLPRCQGAQLAGCYVSAGGRIVCKVGVEDGCALGGGQHGIAQAQQAPALTRPNTSWSASLEQR